jgi:hypothetical protein
MLTAERNAREHPRQRSSTQRSDPLVLPPAQGFPPKNKRIYCIPVLLIRNVYPGSRIQKQQQKRGVTKILVVIPFFIAINLTKLEIILFLKC